MWNVLLFPLILHHANLGANVRTLVSVPLRVNNWHVMASVVISLTDLVVKSGLTIWLAVLSADGLTSKFPPVLNLHIEVCLHKNKR